MLHSNRAQPHRTSNARPVDSLRRGGCHCAIPGVVDVAAVRALRAFLCLLRPTRPLFEVVRLAASSWQLLPGRELVTVVNARGLQLAIELHRLLA